VRQLEQAGHQVVTPARAGITGQSDNIHLQYAAAHDLLLLTKDPDDFMELHSEHPIHAGILLIYQDNDPDRDMAAAEIVRAIANLNAAGIDLRGAIQVLNAWRY
jgi:predicted nuclease of predicted toxin-antitoxin system